MFSYASLIASERILDRILMSAECASEGLHTWIPLGSCWGRIALSQRILAANMKAFASDVLQQPVERRCVVSSNERFSVRSIK